MKDFIIWFLVPVISSLILVGIFFIIRSIQRKRKVNPKEVVKKITSTTKDSPEVKKESKKSVPFWNSFLGIILKVFSTIALILVIVWLIVLSFNGIKKLTTQNKPKIVYIEKEKPKPYYYTKSYIITKSKDVRIIVDRGYYVGPDDYGKKYYEQVFYRDGSNGSKNLIGEGIPSKDNGKKVEYIVYSFYKEEVNLEIQFSKNRNLIK